MAEHPETIVVLDFGSQYNQLIARRVREAHVYCELIPWDAPAERVLALEPAGFILSGGPASVYEPGAPTLPAYVLESGKPVLGICYGMQALTHALDGRVAPASAREYGHAELYIDAPDSPLFAGIPSPTRVWMSHGDRIEQLPAGFRILAHTANAPIAAMGDDERRLYGLQFHPEVHHTVEGRIIFHNFLFRICGLHGLWRPENFIAESIAQIRQRVGKERAICAVSGGVDSTVAATLVSRAIGGQLTCIFVDHGLHRQGEVEENMEAFRRHIQAPTILVDARQRFLRALAGVTDPEEKRRIIGREFIRVFEEEAHKLGRVRYLVQGTIYPDVIESSGAGSGATARIKSHHNVGALPPDMDFELIEPLRMLFKDEVRQVGEALGLPASLVHRQPCPGPALAVRIIGEVTEEKLAILRAADAIVTSEIDAADLGPDKPWQYFAVLTSVRSVGVMGDGRTYQYLVAVRAVSSVDGMTADWSRLPYDLLARISSRIVNEVPGVNRVVYDISSKPPATIEWE
ncbi:MAG: glutamine-hydrolyzing GMP synthase [Anaerolineae bacterium]